MVKQIATPNPHGRDAYGVAYLGLSAISGFAELGAVVLAVRQGWPIAAVIAVGGAYQIGALANSLHQFSRSWFIGFLLAAGALSLAGTFASAQAIALLLFSIGLQGVRELALAQRPMSTFAKRLSRIVGFSAAGLFSPGALALLSVVTAGLALALPRIRMQHGVAWSVRSWLGQTPRAIDIVMVVHQAHYFAYSYALPVLFLRIYGMGALLASLAFALGWVSYSATPLLLKDWPARPTLIGGHLLVATILAAATGARSAGMLLAAWFVTGFGGGTVFLIRRIESEEKEARPVGYLDVWENVGHMFGVLVAVALGLITSRVTTMLIAAAVLATLTAALIAFGSPDTRIAHERGRNPSPNQ